MDRVAKLYPEIFTRLADYCWRNNSTYLDETIDRFDREVQFYVAYLDYLAPLRRAGLSFCYPDAFLTRARKFALMTLSIWPWL